MNPPREASVRAALICYRDALTGSGAVEWTCWNSAGQARQAEVELTPCGLQCIGVHSVVRLNLPRDPRRKAVRRQPSTGRTGNAEAGEVSS